ncbi:MAG TPA: hypothetical protein PLV48_00540 [Rhodocyclaceae bacterium]|nr:hypothetical protein [Rhodocyclaceae bacterium]HMZ83872.1 hypothetical protein [Rhodocyclaceae bacterium]HNA02331.1 hypothetical protein [Rhodocyclaceae bacterium]
MNARDALLIAFTIAAGLALDQFGGPWGQPVVNLWAAGLLAWLAARRLAQQWRALLACLLFATAGEIVLSLVWGLYDYRLGNIPLFVPPGHVLLYCLGTWIAARLPARAAAASVPLIVVCTAALALTGHDLLSVPLTLIFLLAMRFGPAPALYSTMFCLALAMELWGTWLGNWAWRPHAPGIGLATLNPPFAAGAFYCVLDWLVGISNGARRLGAAGQRS